MNTQVNDPKGAVGATKTPLGLIPPFAMAQTAWAHKLGAEKYGPFNWRDTGVCASTYVNAMLRHLNAWRDGEDLDLESGISHLAHIACNCNILLDAGFCRTLQDDRNKKPAQNTFASASANAAAEAVKRASVALDQRDLPIPSEWALPPVPEGYDRWVYRGKGWKTDRKVCFSSIAHYDTDWVVYPFGNTVGYPNSHYIEAIKDNLDTPKS